MRFLNFLAFLFISSYACAAPSIKITDPADGSTINPGQTITVKVEAVDGFVVKEGSFNSFKTDDPDQKFTSLPASFTITISKDAVGKVPISAVAEDSLGNESGEMITLKVVQTATLQSLEISQDKLSAYLDWNDNIKEGEESGYIVTAYGIYSDNVTREIPREELTYTSSDPSVISIDIEGNYQIYKVGQASITVSNSGLSKIIPVVFKKPTGMRPRETIPPTIQIDIQPQPNSAGWHNSDITITLTAQDNEGGSGVEEIYYEFPYISAKDHYTNNDRIEIPFSEEGKNLFRYGAHDKERNTTGQQSTELRLDKTPPILTPSVSPKPNASGWNNTDVTITFNAIDKLSGVKNATSPVTIITEGTNQLVTGEAIDIADNKSSTSVSLNIDKTPPKVTLTATPNILWSPDNKMVDVVIKGEATDSLSGIDSLTFKVTDEYGKVQPTLTGFNSTIKLEASRNGDDKDGRTYTITATAKDKAGNESMATAIVTVPHDQRKK
ncbi:hypothetical protein EPO66_01145 [bacterium]|nr:MAG: hypothetical protein EPO66_01145 [bacterium]